MAEEDFEIDIYGDGSGENDAPDAGREAPSHDANSQAYESNSNVTVANGSNASHAQTNAHSNEYETESQDHHEMETAHEDGSAKTQPQQGVKRKEGSDDRPIDPGATNCLLVSDLNWWNTDDDVRGWVKQAGGEDELKDITFSEHKVNGKSKG